MPQRLRLAPLKTCDQRKERHYEKAKAEGLRLFLISVGQHQPEKGILHVYRCEECSAWHLGHKRSETKTTLAFA